MIKSSWGQIIGLLLLSYIVFTSNISGVDLYPYDEARNAGCAWEMMEKNEWLIPSFNGDLRFHKPPLHYYFMIAGYKLFGYNGLGARFFSAWMGILTVLSVFLFSRMYLSSGVAWIASLALLSSIHFVLQMHMAVPDPYLIFLLTAGLLLCYHAIQKKSLIMIIAAYALIGFAALTKGPVAIAISGLAVLIYLLITGQFSVRKILQFKPFAGITILALVALPWYIYIGTVTEGRFTEGFFLIHNLQRFSAPMEGHGGIFLLTWLFVAVGMLPLSVYVLHSIAHAWKNRKPNDSLAFIFACAASVIIIFSISRTKLPNYTVPSYPFLAILIASFICKAKDIELLPFHLKLPTFLFLLLGIAAPVGAYFGLQSDSTVAHLKMHALYLIPLSIGGLLAVYYILKNKLVHAVTVKCVSFVLVGLFFFWLIYPQFDKENPVRAMTPLIEENAYIWGYKLFNPAFVISLEKIIPVLAEEEDLQEILNSDQSGYLITRKNYAEELEKYDEVQLIGSKKDLFEMSTTAIFKIEN